MWWESVQSHAIVAMVEVKDEPALPGVSAADLASKRVDWRESAANVVHGST
jgi:hypothetical protein